MFLIIEVTQLKGLTPNGYNCNVWLSDHQNSESITSELFYINTGNTIHAEYTGKYSDSLFHIQQLLRKRKINNTMGRSK